MWKLKILKQFLLDIQTKCGDIVIEILNAAIDAERTLKCKWPYIWFHNWSVAVGKWRESKKWKWFSCIVSYK